METKHTKGKWEVKPAYGQNDDNIPLFYDIAVDGNHFISTHKNSVLEIDFTQDLANAKLIASAPEMLEEHENDLKELQLLYDFIFNDQGYSITNPNLVYIEKAIER